MGKERERERASQPAVIPFSHQTLSLPPLPHFGVSFSGNYNSHPNQPPKHTFTIFFSLGESGQKASDVAGVRRQRRGKRIWNLGSVCFIRGKTAPAFSPRRIEEPGEGRNQRKRRIKGFVPSFTLSLLNSCIFFVCVSL